MDEELDGFLKRVLGAHHASSSARWDVLEPADVERAVATLEGDGLAQFIRLYKRLPDELLGSLACHDSTGVRRAVAGRGAMRRMPDVVAALADDVQPSVREAIARNHRVPLDWIEHLGNDESLEVRWVVERRMTK